MDDNQYELKIMHLCFGIIVMNNKHCRSIIARVDTVDYPIVFMREWYMDPEEGYIDNYALYRSALTSKEADEILELLKNNQKRKANNLFKRYFKAEGTLCEFVGEVRLDDAVPDEWYDLWKHMEGLITFHRDYPGYYEANVQERDPWC